MSRDFVRRFKVGLVGGFFDIAAFGRLGGVDVNGNQRFGVVNHQLAAGRQLHVALVGGFYLPFNLIAGKERDIILIQLEFVEVVRHHQRHEIAGLLIDALVVNEYLADVRAQVVAQGADDDVTFLINQALWLRFAVFFGNCLPQLQEEIQVPLQFFLRPANARSPHDNSHVFRDIKHIERFAQFFAVITLDAARYASGARVVRHQHEEASGEADISGQRRAFVAAFFFVNLNQYFLPDFNHVFERQLAFMRGRGAGQIFLADFLERQEAVPLRAIIDKGRFQRGFNPGNLTFVNIGFFLGGIKGFNIKIVELLAINQRHPQFFLLGCVYKHTFHSRESPQSHPSRIRLIIL